MAGTVICDYINSANVSGGFLGIGQTWQDVTGSRSIGGTYTNSTGRPIMVSIVVRITLSLTTASFRIDVGGVTANACLGYGNTGTIYTNQNMTVIVPDGSTYILQRTSGTQAMINWYELR